MSMQRLKSARPVPRSSSSPLHNSATHQRGALFFARHNMSRLCYKMTSRIVERSVKIERACLTLWSVGHNGVAEVHHQSVHQEEWW